MTGLTAQEVFHPAETADGFSVEFAAYIMRTDLIALNQYKTPQNVAPGNAGRTLPNFSFSALLEVYQNK